jgi:hypothetical protein
MTDRLHKFIPVHEIIERAGRFHDSACGMLSQWATQVHEAGDVRTGAFLELAAQHERSVADSLTRALSGGVDLSSADTYYQNPPETIPNEEEVASLRDRINDLDAFAAGLHDTHQRWVDVYKALEQSNPSGRVAELLRSCRELVERLLKQLSSAQVQAQDA